MYEQDARPSQHETMTAAIADLYSNVAGKRTAAVRVLTDMGEPAIPILMDTLILSRASAMQALLSKREKRPLTAPAYRDEWAREGAAEALRAIGRPAIRPLIEALQRGGSQSRAAAAYALKGVHDAAVTEALRAALQREIAVSREEYEQWRTGKLAISLTIAVIVALLFSAAFVFRMYDLILGTVGSLLGIGGAIFAGFADTGAKVRGSVVEALSASQDCRLIGPLAVCLSDKNAVVQKSAVRTLTRLLPQAQASDKAFLSSGEMSALIEALNHADTKLTVAILKAFEQIGDERALPEVERLATTGEANDIREAAQKCLPSLQEQIHKTRQAQELLRPSDSGSATAPNTLLRPAQAGNTTTEQTQLLRSLE